MSNWADWGRERRSVEFTNLTSSPKVELTQADIGIILHQYYVLNMSIDAIAAKFDYGNNVVRGVVSHNLYKSWVNEWGERNGYE